MTTILTLTLDPAAQAHFNALRQQHYPAHRNQIEAHLTLFHSLPDTPEIAAALAAAAHTASFTVAVTALMPLGAGVAFRCKSPELEALHQHLATAFAAHITPQDRQPFRPHIVIQNKSTPVAARALLADLAPTFTPSSFQATGLTWWNYLDGPWQLREHFPFA